MQNHYHKAVHQLEVIKSDNQSNYKQMRHKAQNVVNVYGDEQFKGRFDGMVKFRIHDHRSDSEKQQVITRAIDNAIHYFRVKGDSIDAQHDFAQEAPAQSVMSSGRYGKVISLLLAIVVVVLTFLIFNNFPRFVFHLTGLQFLMVGMVIALFAFNFFKHKVDDKWLAVALSVLPIILQILLKKLGVEF